MLIREKPSIKRIIFVASLILTLLCVGIAFSWKFLPFLQQTTKMPTVLAIVDKPAEKKTAPTLAKKESPVFNLKKYSTTEASSLWVVTNKSHQLTPIDYEPTDLIITHGGTVRSIIEADLNQMIDTAEGQGINLTIVSSYRSYGYQASLYNNYVNQYSQAMTDTFSARPGYSEHQTGLAIDFGGTSKPVCSIDDCFADTTEGQWLEKYATNYGFLLRYTATKQATTGYKAEAWHYRYVGKNLLTEMKKRSITTLEEFFEINGGEKYV